MRNTLLNVASWVVLGLFCATFVLSFFVPIYTDEIVIKLTRVQVFLDGFERISLFPQCKPTFSQHIPLTWVPSALIDWIVYGNVTNPIFLRLIGISAFSIWLGILAWFAMQKWKAQASSLYIIAGLISFISLGILPFLMVLSRSEQPLLLGLTLICIVPYIVAQYPPKTNRAWVFLAILFFLIISYMFSSHGKTFFFVPLMLVSALYLSIISKRIWVSFVLLAGLALICYDSLNFWSAYYYCPDAPLLYAVLNAHTLSIGELFAAPEKFILAGLRNSTHFYVYIKNALFHGQYQSNWLPSSGDHEMGWFPSAIDVVVGLIYLSTVGYIVLALVKKLRTNFHERKLEQETAIPLALFVGMLSCSFILEDKNFYESSLFLPLFILLAFLLLPISLNTNQICRACPFIFKSLLIISILSQFNLILTFAAYIPSPWLTGGKIAGQGLSISSFNYTNTRKNVIDAAANCDIKEEDLNKHLVIDDSTYFPFKDAYRPFHALYIANFFGKDIGDENLIPFLREKESAGVITSCDSLSLVIRKLSTKSGNYCCISRQNINWLGLSHALDK